MTDIPPIFDFNELKYPFFFMYLYCVVILTVKSGIELYKVVFGWTSFVFKNFILEPRILCNIVYTNKIFQGACPDAPFVHYS